MAYSAAVRATLVGRLRDLDEVRRERQASEHIEFGVDYYIQLSGELRKKSGTAKFLRRGTKNCRQVRRPRDDA